MRSIKKGDVYRYTYGPTKQEWVLEEVVKVDKHVHVTTVACSKRNANYDIGDVRKYKLENYQGEIKLGYTTLDKEYKFKRLIEAYEKVKGDMATNA